MFLVVSYLRLVGAVVTLFVLMQLTGRIDWAEVLERRNDPAPSR